MFDIGMSELLVIGTVALIVIGPKDLPELFRSLGRMTAKMRAMSREFSRAMEAAADESGMKDVADDLRRATSAKSMGLDAVKDAASKFEKWDPLKPAPRATPKPGPKPDPAAPRGPATQAVADAQAERKAAALNAADMLKKPAAMTGDAPEAAAPTPKTAVKPAPKPAAKPRATAAAAAPASPDAKPAPAKKPRAPRKPKPKADA